MKKLLIIIALIYTATPKPVLAQSLAVNTTGAVANTSALLDVSSTTKGLLIPRMTTAQRTAIATPATGLMVYDLTTASQWFYNGAAWEEFHSTSNAWSQGGNTLTAASSLGSLNAFTYDLLYNGTTKMTVGSTLRLSQASVNATGAAPAASAMLDVSSTTQGMLVPRMTSAQRTAIAAPSTGLWVYDTTTGTFWYYDGTVWQQSASLSDAWSLAGNTIAATDFMGTVNAQPLKFYCNNVERFRINPADGEIVAGATASPYAGDLLNAVGTATLPFALAGYTSQNGGAGTWGEVMSASSTAFSAVQGVYGGSGLGAGVLGNYDGTNVSSTRTGVFGICSTPAATNGGAGVTGYNNIASGNQHVGVLGYYSGSSFGIGVIGIGFGGGTPAGNNDYAVVGWRANNNNYSGYFNGNHVIANGTKSASVGTQWGNQLLYVTESPEVWFEDIGRGKLVNGKCTIELDSIFRQVTVIDSAHPMHVFVQPEGECEDLYVIPGTSSFTVKEKKNGQSEVTFSYRIMAKRVNFQDHRYGNDPLWGEGDTRPYMQYAAPPPIDYEANLRFQMEQRKNYKPSPMPKGFITYEQLQAETEERMKFATRPQKAGN